MSRHFGQPPTQNELQRLEGVATSSPESADTNPPPVDAAGRSVPPRPSVPAPGPIPDLAIALTGFYSLRATGTAEPGSTVTLSLSFDGLPQVDVFPFVDTASGPADPVTGAFSIDYTLPILGVGGGASDGFPDNTGTVRASNIGGSGPESAPVSFLIGVNFSLVNRWISDNPSHNPLYIFDNGYGRGPPPVVTVPPDESDGWFYGLYTTDQVDAWIIVTAPRIGTDYAAPLQLFPVTNMAAPPVIDSTTMAPHVVQSQVVYGPDAILIAPYDIDLLGSGGTVESIRDILEQAIPVAPPTGKIALARWPNDLFQLRLKPTGDPGFPTKIRTPLNGKIFSPPADAVQDFLMALGLDEDPHTSLVESALGGGTITVPQTGVLSILGHGLQHAMQVDMRPVTPGDPDAPPAINVPFSVYLPTNEEVPVPELRVSMAAMQALLPGGIFPATPSLWYPVVTTPDGVIPLLGRDAIFINFTVQPPV